MNEWTTESRIFWLAIGVILGLLTMTGCVLLGIIAVLRLGGGAS